MQIEFATTQCTQVYVPVHETYMRISGNREIQSSITVMVEKMCRTDEDSFRRLQLSAHTPNNSFTKQSENNVEVNGAENYDMRNGTQIGGKGIKKQKTKQIYVRQLFLCVT